MPITCLLVDDNEMERTSSRQLIDKIPELQLIADCEDPFKARDILMSQKPELVFLDIEMPGLTGIQLVKSLLNPPLFIFITSHPNYAADGFEMDAVDFLVKPFTHERLLRAVSKTQLHIQWKNESSSSEQFKSNDNDSFFIKEKNTFIKINIGDVDYFESLGNFVNIFLTGGKKLIALVSMKNLEQQLPASTFIRVSRTHMVNRKKITAINSTHVYLGRLSFGIGATYADGVMKEVVGDKGLKRFLQ